MADAKLIAERLGESGFDVTCATELTQSGMAEVIGSYAAKVNEAGTNTISFFREIGILFVGVFFFTSGYGLHRSFSTKPDYLKGFFKRRIFPIVCSCSQSGFSPCRSDLQAYLLKSFCRQAYMLR